MKSLELKQKREGLLAEMDVLANKAEKLTDAEKARWTELNDTLIPGLDKEIRMEEQKENHLRNRAANQGSALTPGEEKDLKNYSFVKAIQENLKGTLTGLELEMDQEGRKEMAAIGKEISGFCISSKVLRMPGFKRADITTATAPLVQTNLVGFIDALYSKLFCVQAGAQVMSGLTGNLSIPRVATGATTGWATEVADAS